MTRKRGDGCRTGDAEGCGAPEPGKKIDLSVHRELFPAGGGVLTTGARTTHVTAGRYIVLGPQDIRPLTLAHEFGHVLGFRVVYFRGYEDLGEDGFEVSEIVPDPQDIMSSPGHGTVRRFHFERLLPDGP